MNKFHFTTILILTINLAYGQKAPLRPKSPKPSRQESVRKSNNSSSMRMYGEQIKTVLPKFAIPLSASTDLNSVYYFKTIEERLIQLDTTITAEQIISLTKFNIFKNQIDPNFLDSLANKTYEQNEEKNYSDAIITAKLLLGRSPNNITGHKEIALAYKRIGKNTLSNLHLSMMVKIIMSVFKYGDGTYDYPFLVNNFFEGISIYEGAFRCKPNKMTVMLDKKGRLLGAYNGYSSAMDEILIRYSELSHWKSLLKEGDYIKEE